FQFQQTGAGRLAFSRFVDEGAALDSGVGAVHEPHARVGRRGMAAEAVGADRGQRAFLDQQVPVPAGVNAVAADDDAVALGQVDVVLLAADDVAGDGDQVRPVTDI